MLDFNQEQAVQFGEGLCLTIAGPGSGKTTVLTHRIRYLIRELHIPAEQILVITFTKEAAEQMRERFLRMTSGQVTEVFFATFHALFFRILKEDGGYGADALQNQEERRSLAVSSLAAIGEDWDEAKLRSYLAYADREMGEEGGHSGDIVLPGSAKEAMSLADSMEESSYLRFAELYREKKRQKKRLDYADMLKETFSLLRDNESIRRKWSYRFRMILVDEAQDMSRLQWQLLLILSEKWGNLFLVGDDDQSIYGFRGASASLLLEIARDYPSCQTIYLTRNYRSAQVIVERARSLIEHNEMRFAKELSAVSEKRGHMSYQSCADPTQEAKMVAAAIKRQMRKSEESIAVLYRNHAQARALTRVLQERGIPFCQGKSADSGPSIFLLDIIAYIQLALGEGKREDLLRILNRPMRGLSRDIWEEEEIDWKRLLTQASSREKGASGDALLLLYEDLMRMRLMSPYAAICYLLGKMSYGDFIKKEESFDEEEQKGILQLALFRSGKGTDAMRSFLEKLKEGRSMRTDAGESVFLYSYHASKGLEFDRLHLIDLNEGIVPSQRAKSREEIAEERRLFYVALTRAKKSVCLYSVQKMGSKKRSPSRFLQEMQGEKKLRERSLMIGGEITPVGSHDPPAG